MDEEMNVLHKWEWAKTLSIKMMPIINANKEIVAMSVSETLIILRKDDYKAMIIKPRDWKREYGFVTN